MKSNFFVSLTFLALTVLIFSTLSVEAQYRNKMQAEQAAEKEGSPYLKAEENVDDSDSNSDSNSDSDSNSEEDEEENIRLKRSDADDVPLNRRPRDVSATPPPPKDSKEDSDEGDSEEDDDPTL